MLTETLHPVVAALRAEEHGILPDDMDRYIDRCWRVLWSTQFRRRGCQPLSICESIAMGDRYAWRGFDGVRGGDVFGL